MKYMTRNRLLSFEDICAHALTPPAPDESCVGATTQIFLPIQKETAPASAANQCLKGAPVVLAGKSVLIVDDDEALREVTCEILQAAAMHVLQASNGKTCLQLVQQYSGKIDLILLDISLPGMSGVEVMQQLRELQPDLRILLFSGYAQYKVAHQLGTTVDYSFLQKPYGLRELLRAIEQQFQPR